MKKSILVSVIVILLTVVINPTVALADFYAYSHTDNSIYKSSGPTLQFTKIGTLETLSYPATNNGGLVKASESSAYMTERFTDLLYTVSLNDASMISVVQLDYDMKVNGRGLDISPSGILYGVFKGSQLRTVDPQTGITTFLTYIDIPGIESIAFSSSGILYAGTDSGDLYELNITNGSVSLISNTPILDIDALTFASDGYLYATDALLTVADLYRVDPLTGTTVNFGSTGLTEVNGLLAIGDIELVPVPSAVILGSIGLTFSGWLLRRRRML